MTLRDRIDRSFEAWGRTMCARRHLVLSLCLLFLAAMASFLPHMRAENDTQNYLHSGDPASIEYEDFQRRFGQDDRILITVESPEIFDLAFLDKLRAFHVELEAELPHLREVTSLVNVRQTRGQDDVLIVEDLMEDWPETAADLAGLRRRVYANPLYVDNVISRSGRFTALSVEPVVYAGGGEGAEAALAGFDEPTGEARVRSDGGIFLSEDQKRELVAALWPVVDRYESADFRIFVVGSSVVASQITGRMTSDSRAHVSAVALAIVLFLFFLFRRVSGVLFPMAVVAASLISVLGLMVWIDMPFSIVLSMLPVFTMCVGVCYAVHVLVLVYQRLAEGSGREEAVAYAFGHSGVAILMTSVTTAAGMLSFLTAALAPVRNLGIIAPCGVLFAFLFSMTLLPALIAIFPLDARPRIGATPQRSWPQRLMVWTGDLAVRRRGAVLGGAVLLVVVASVGLLRVRFAHVPLEWLPVEDPVRVASELVNRELRGATTAELLIDTGRENGLQEPATLARIDTAIHRVESLDRGALFVGKATSLVDIVKETHQALNANDPAFYRIPEEPALVAQELLLFENSGSDDLEEITDSQFRRGRVTLRLPLVDAVLYGEFLDEIEAVFAESLGDATQIVLTGRSPLSARTFSATIESMARSYVVALLVITPLMMLLIGDIRLGLTSMLPNLLPVFFVLAAMGLLGIPLDASSIMVGSIVIGLAVDDTIHFLHRFGREFALSGDTRGAVRATLTTTGTALFFTSLVLATGFGVMGTLGTLKNTVVFGYLTALGIAIAFLADALLTPSLLAFAVRKLTTARPPGYGSGETQPPP